MKKKTLALILALAMAFSLTACGGGNDGGQQQQQPSGGTTQQQQQQPSGGEQQPSGGGTGETYKLSFAAIDPAEQVHVQASQTAIDRIAEATNDEVQITLYPAGQLGDYMQIYDEVIAGTIDMALIPVPGSYDTFLEAQYLPFLISDYEQYKQVFAPGSPMFDELEAHQLALGYTPLAYYPGGFIGIGYTDLKGDTAEVMFDPTAKKNSKIRIPNMEYVLKTLEPMNFNVTPMNYSDVYTSLQTGIIDGSWNSGVYMNYESFRDILKYFLDYRATADTMTVIMNTGKLEALPAEYQTIVKEIFLEEMANATDALAVMDEEYAQKMIDYGIEVWVPTDEQRANIQEYVIANVYPALADFYGQDFIDSCVEFVAGL